MLDVLVSVALICSPLALILLASCGARDHRAIVAVQRSTRELRRANDELRKSIRGN